MKLNHEEIEFGKLEVR